MLLLLARLLLLSSCKKTGGSEWATFIYHNGFMQLRMKSSFNTIHLIVVELMTLKAKNRVITNRQLDSPVDLETSAARDTLYKNEHRWHD